MKKIRLRSVEHDAMQELGIERIGQDRFLIHGGEKQFKVSVKSRESGGGIFSLDGERIRYYAARTPGMIEVWVAGKVYSFQTESTGLSRTRDNQLIGDPEVTAPMPGRIVKVSVKTGDAVNADQPVLVMESMKMEITLTAPKAGVIKQVQCDAGDLVDIGQTLVVLE